MRREGAEPLAIKRHILHAEKSSQNLIKSNWNQIVFTIYRLIWKQTDVRSVQNQSKNAKYNLISVLFNMISKRFLCVLYSPQNDYSLNYALLS